MTYLPIIYVAIVLILIKLADRYWNRPLDQKLDAIHKKMQEDYPDYGKEEGAEKEV